MILHKAIKESLCNVLYIISVVVTLEGFDEELFYACVKKPDCQNADSIIPFKYCPS